jgi:hypothetical protein
MKKLIFSVLLTFASAGALCAKEWRGIVPLHSTRADVERLLKKTNPECQQCVYVTEEVSVVVVYSSGSACGKEESNRWNVPHDTVISLTVYYKNPRLKFADLKIDESKFEKETTAHLPGVVYYTNRDEGMHIEVIGGAAQSITYFYRAKDKNLLCSDAAPNNSFNRTRK